MLGELVYEEKGKTTGVRVISSDQGGVTLEITLSTEGKILGVGERSIWTYTSRTRPDGSIYGEGKGLMTTKDGDVLQLVGQGGTKAASSDGSIRYRGALYFHTAFQKFAKLNGTTAVFEYDVDPEGNTVAKAWEWK